MRLPKAIKILFIAVVYFVIAVASLRLSFHSSNASPVWPASGFALTVLLFWRPQMAYGIFIGAFLANVYVFLHNHTCPVSTAVWVSLLIGIGNSCEALAGYFLVKRFLPEVKTENLFKNVQSTYRFVVAALLMCVASSAIGATSILAADIIQPAEFLPVWFTWWTGDVSGVLLVTPFLVALFGQPLDLTNRLTASKFLEAVLLIFAVVLMSGIIFWNWLHPNPVFSRAFVVTPFLIWAAIRLDQRIVLTLLLFSAFAALTGTLRGTGPFIMPMLNHSLLAIEVFVSINVVMVLLLQAALMERKRHELYLKEARNRLEDIVVARTKELHAKNIQLEKRNSELAFFSFSASHDLREPLRKIEYFSNKILEGGKVNTEHEKDLFRRIRATSQRMNQLIENLLSYSLLEDNGKLFQPTDLNLILDEVENNLSLEIQQTGAIIDCGILPVVNGIRFQFVQLFTNILNNSLKFRRPDTSPHISIESFIENEPLYDGEVIIGKSYLHLTFRDNGIGFESEYANKVFDILQKLHGQNEYQGTGIGLAICKKIVENHQGLISADAEPGKGTAIHIYLPVTSSENEAEEEEQKMMKQYL
jgi:signal transduction histidine kinase